MDLIRAPIKTAATANKISVMDINESTSSFCFEMITYQKPEENSDFNVLKPLYMHLKPL